MARNSLKNYYGGLSVHFRLVACALPHAFFSCPFTSASAHICSSPKKLRYYPWENCKTTSKQDFRFFFGLINWLFEYLDLREMCVCVGISVSVDVSRPVCIYTCFPAHQSP